MDFYGFLWIPMDSYGWCNSTQDDLLSVGLCKYDRLLPSKSLPDVSDFENTDVPMIVTFWRMTKQDRLRHDSPMLELVDGITVESFAVDLLHCWALGPLSVLIAFCFHFYIQTGLFSPLSAYLGAEECERLALLHLKALLMKSYKDRYKNDPEWRRKGSQALVFPQTPITNCG
jgi:hypothetical protein